MIGAFMNFWQSTLMLPRILHLNSHCSQGLLVAQVSPPCFPAMDKAIATPHLHQSRTNSRPMMPWTYRHVLTQAELCPAAQNTLPLPEWVAADPGPTLAYKASQNSLPGLIPVTPKAMAMVQRLHLALTAQKRAVAAKEGYHQP